MKKRGKGRPHALDERQKICLSVSEDVINQAKTAALKSSRSLSGFFEIAAKREIERVNATQETKL